MGAARVVPATLARPISARYRDPRYGLHDPPTNRIPCWQEWPPEDMILPMPAASARSLLVQAFDWYAPAIGPNPTHWPSLQLLRIVAPTRKTAMLYEPSLCLVARGKKRAHFGGRVYEYSPARYLLTALPLPVEAEIVEGTPERPTLALVLKLDVAQVAQLVLELGDEAPTPAGGQAESPMYTAPITEELERAVAHLIHVGADATRCRVLGPGAAKEVLYHLVVGEQGARLRELALRDAVSQRVARAVKYVHEHFAEAIDVDTLARTTGMSSSTLYHRFKEVTTLSPIQYQKRVRLHQARLLMLARGLGASEAAFQVGYSSPSQFSREFKHLFGEPPSVAIVGLKQKLAAD